MDDETGLYYYGARYYDPVTSVWQSVDALATKFVDKTPYGFMSENPINKVDPTGNGDYYNYDGTYLGSDRIRDDKTYVVHSIDPSSAANGLSKQQLLNIRDGEHLGYTQPTAYELPIKHSEFKAIAGTIYAEGASTFEESAGIYSVMRNRATAKGKSVYKIASGGGIYGWGERNKINSPNAIKANVRNANRAVITGLTSNKDYSGGGFYWHGKDFGLENWKAYKDYYQVGFKFTNSSHDLWGLGNKVSGNSDWDYKYQSTGAAGSTTFMKLTDEWIKKNKYKSKW